MSFEAAGAPEALPEGDEKVEAVRSMFDAIAPRYDLVNRLMTFGLDVRWRRRTVAALHLSPGSIVADVACGTGDICRELDRQALRPIGFDLSLGMLRSARAACPLVQSDALCLPLPDASVDGLTCGFALRNVVDLPAFLAETGRVVRAAGRIALLEVASPTRRLPRAVHSAYFGHVVPKIGGLLSDGDAYRYLPRSVAYLPSPAELVEMVADAGFSHVRRELLGAGAAQLITAVRSDPSWA